MADTSASIARDSEFLLRRLHSLFGIIPLGVFLVMHLTTNVMILFTTPGKDAFQDKVNLIHSLGPLLMPVEIFGIFLPLAFHAGLGVKIWLEGRSNVGSYRYLGNLRYTLQRISGGIVLVFVLVHLWQMHWLGAWLGGAKFVAEAASVTAAETLQASRGWAGPLYAIGIAAAAYHFANGIWTSLITWGIAVGPAIQRKSGYVCAVIGVALTFTGLAALGGFMRFDVEGYRQASPPVRTEAAADGQG